jgi:hypothetical protein
MDNFSGLAQFVSMLPKVVDALLQCDSLMREHEEAEAMKYSQQEYLQSVYRLYKSRQITSAEAKKALSLVFRDDAVNISVTPVDEYILKLLK